MALADEMKWQGQWLFRWRSYLPLLIIPLLIVVLHNSEYPERVYGDFAELIWEVFCICVSFFGLFIRCVTVGYVPKGTSGRHTRGQKADSLNTTGMYSIARNPIYLGNFFIILGLLLFISVWWFVLMSILIFWIFYERIIFTEESYLKEQFGAKFSEWAGKTPIFMPNFKLWRKPELPFSFRAVLRKEHSTFFSIVASFTLIDIAADLLIERRFETEPAMIIFFSAGLLIYLILRTLKKQTHLLDVAGR